jgi:hypothetical protein
VSSKIEWMQQEGSLKNTDDYAVIPKLIDDAIELVVRLSWRYIWIDRYCIMQDDGPAKAVQINSMNFIYAGAYATIVAAEGAGEGIKGIKGQSEPRSHKSIMNHATNASFQSLQDNDGDTKAKRGWKTIGRDRLQAFATLLQSTAANDEPIDDGETLFQVSSVDSIDSVIVNDGAGQSVAEKQRSTDRKMLEAQAYLLMRSPWY